MSMVYIFSGPFGGGKTVTGLSFLPNGWTHKIAPRRTVIDFELRAGIYKSPDEKDYPERKQFAFQTLAKGRPTANDVYEFMKAVKTRSYGKEAPHEVMVDDTAMLQETMHEWWKDKPNALKTAQLFGLERDRCLTAVTWKPTEPGTLNFFKRLFTEFIMELKTQDITLIITSPQHNIWQDYGKKGYDADGNPKMRVVGKSAKVWDCWLQLCDVLWILDRTVKQGNILTLRNLPRVSMDVHIPKASMPGVPESFDWPAVGWPEVWRWFNERTYTADVSKLKSEEPQFSPEDAQAMLNRQKMKLLKELGDIATRDEIYAVMMEEDAPPFTSEDYQDLLEYVRRVIKERKAKPS